MFSGSIHLMTAIDLLILAVSAFVVIRFYRNRKRTQVSGETTSKILISAGFFIFVAFFAADLYAMWVMPRLVGMKAAMSAMENLHLNISWFAIPLAVCAMALGHLRGMEIVNTALERATDSEKQLQEIVNNAADGIITIDDDGIVESYNPSVERMFGYADGELIGNNVAVLMAEPDRSRHDDYLGQYQRTGKGKILGVGPREVTGRRKDGSTFTLELAVGEMHLGERRIFIGTLRDTTKRKEAEEALRLTQFALDHAGDAVFWLGEKGEFKYINKFGQRMLGYSWDELSAMHIWDVDPDAAQADWTRIWARVRSREPYTFEAVHVTKDGSNVPVEVTTAHVSFDGRPIICAFSRDITERKQVEAALRDSEAKLNAFFENAPVGLGTFDNQLRYTKINEALARLNGIPAEEHIGRTIADVMPALAPIVSSQYREILETGKPQLNTEFTAKFPGMEGDEQHRMLSRFPIPGHDGKPVGVGAVALDITERKLAEKAAKESEEKYRSLVELSPDAVFVQQAGIIVFANSAAATIYGADEPEQLVGREMTSLVHPVDRQVLLERREALKHGEKKQVFGALRRLRFDGSIFYGESVVSDIPWQGAHASLIVIRDITERQAIEEQLRQSQKMEVVGQLTGGVAHEFNNLLAVIIGNLDVAQEKDAGDQDIAGNLAQAMKAADRSADLTKQLLAFSRKQALMPRQTDLNDLMSGFLDLLRPTLGETIEVESIFADDLWPAIVDPKQIETAILSLAINARDAMPGGGKLTIASANVPISNGDFAEDAQLEPGDYVTLSVTDTGTGMPPEVIKHVFEPFYTTKEVGQGTGLGLSMVHGFVKQSDGHIEVVSEVGAGTTFKIYLPRATEAPAEIS